MKYLLSILIVLCVFACDDRSDNQRLDPTGGQQSAGADAEVEAGADAEVEAGADAEVEAGADTEVEAGADAEVEAGAEVEAPIFQYLRGTSTTTSPEGILFEEVEVLVKRTITYAAGTIVEETLHGAEPRRTLFTLRPGTLIFNVSDEANTFTGTVSFASGDWLSSDVTYNITLTGQYPGSLTGTGVWVGDTYTTDKAFANADGVVEARIAEVLRVIQEEEYSASLPD